MTRLSLNDIWTIIVLHQKFGYSQSLIAKEIPCTKGAVSKTLKRFTDTGNVVVLPKSGRPSLIPIANEDENVIDFAIKINRKINSFDLAKTLKKKHKISVSARTVRRTRKLLGYRSVLVKICPLITDLGIEKRLAYVKKHAKNDWKDVISSLTRSFLLLAMMETEYGRRLTK